MVPTEQWMTAIYGEQREEDTTDISHKTVVNGPTAHPYWSHQVLHPPTIDVRATQLYTESDVAETNPNRRKGNER